MALDPSRANAFWFFSVDASAASNNLDLIPSTPILQAAINIDPNPHKGLGEIIQTSGNAMLAYTGPSGTIADVATAIQPDRISAYVVRPGDSLSAIGKMFNVSPNTIIWANDLKGAYDIHPGDTLIILPISGIKRTVVKGDTLRSIAKKYSADVDEIAKFNGLDPSEPLAVGSTLIVPGGDFTPVTPAPTAAKSTSSKTIYEPYLGGSGASQPGYYGNPVPGGIITQKLHGWNGIDLGAPRGTPIHAAAAGTVIISRSNGAWNGGYGNYVVITHDNGTQTLYSHMTQAIVSYGQSVSAGQIIGYVGSTGLSTGSHLHFEVRGAANPLLSCALRSYCSAR